MHNNTYIPGVCNIGETEILARKRLGWIGLVATILVWGIVSYFGLNHYWLSMLVITASISATGFIQSYLHFCAGFGVKGLFNFGTELGHVETVQQQEFRSKDKKKALLIFAYSLIIGIVVTLIACYI